MRFDFKGSLLYSSVPDRSPLHKICVSDVFEVEERLMFRIVPSS